MTIDINGDVIDEITIDGQGVSEVTIDGDIVYQVFGTQSKPASSIQQVNEYNDSTGTYYVSPPGYSGSEEVFCSKESDGNLYANFKLDPSLTNNTNAYFATKRDRTDNRWYSNSNSDGMILNNFSQFSSINDVHITYDNVDENTQIQDVVEYDNPQTGFTYSTSFIESLREELIHSFTDLVSTADDQDGLDPNSEFYLGRGDSQSGEYLVTPTTGNTDPRRVRYRLRNGTFEAYAIDSQRNHPSESNGGDYFMPTRHEYGQYAGTKGSDHWSWGYDGNVMKVR